MYFAIYCTDGSDGPRLRKEYAQVHLDHIDAISDNLMLAGPCVAPGSDAYDSSFLVVEADDAAAAQALVESDPYFKSGVWNSVIVREFKVGRGKWAPQ